MSKHVSLNESSQSEKSRKTKNAKHQMVHGSLSIEMIWLDPFLITIIA